MGVGALIGGVVAAAGAVGSAAIASSDRKKGLAAAGRANEATAAEIDKTRAAQQELLDTQSDPSALFAKLLLQQPELLNKILPSLRQSSIDTANQFTKSNLETRQAALAGVAPDFNRLSADRVSMIDQLNPNNLGADEIAAITRKLSPLIPEGTFDPNKGSVKGGTTNPVSLYRNLISGAYNERRTQFLGENRAYLSDAENSAARQQSQAGQYLPGFLNLSYQAAGKLSSETLTQEQQAIQLQQGYINALLGVPTAAFNTAGSDQAFAQGIQGAASGLGSAIAAYQKINSTPSTTVAGGTSTTQASDALFRSTPYQTPPARTPDYQVALPV